MLNKLTLIIILITTFSSCSDNKKEELKFLNEEMVNYKNCLIKNNELLYNILMGDYIDEELNKYHFKLLDSSYLVMNNFLQYLDSLSEKLPNANDKKKITYKFNEVVQILSQNLKVEKNSIEINIPLLKQEKLNSENENYKQNLLLMQIDILKFQNDISLYLKRNFVAIGEPLNKALYIFDNKNSGLKKNSVFEVNFAYGRINSLAPNGFLLDSLKCNGVPIKCKKNIDLQNDGIVKLFIYPEKQGNYTWNGTFLNKLPSGNLDSISVSGEFIVK